MNRRAFEQVVRNAIEQLPERFHHALENVAIVVKEEPDPEELERLGMDPDEDELFGLYVGIPLIERECGFSELPDQIEVYRGPILRSFDTYTEILHEIQETVIHELGHHMGLSDEEMPD